MEAAIDEGGPFEGAGRVIRGRGDEGGGGEEAG